MMLELDPDQLKAVGDFCEITGTSVETVIYEALADHIECCLPPRLEEFAERSGAWPDAYSTISHYLGHANLNTTNRYVKVDLEMGAAHSYPRGIGLTRRLGAELQHNPALFVKGPKFSRKMGVTPIMEAKEVRVLLDSIAIMPRIKVPKKLGGGHKEVADIKGLRDRAAMAIMVYTFARVSAVVGLKRSDYMLEGKRARLRLLEKGNKEPLVWLHHEAEAYLDAHIAAAGIDRGEAPPVAVARQGA